MEAEDTVMGCIKKATDKFPIRIRADGVLMGLEAREKCIADISFKAGLAEGDKERYDIGVSDGKVEGVAEGIREVVEILRKLGWGRAADDVEIYLGLPEKNGG